MKMGRIYVKISISSPIFINIFICRGCEEDKTAARNGTLKTCYKSLLSLLAKIKVKSTKIGARCGCFLQQLPIALAYFSTLPHLFTPSFILTSKFTFSVLSLLTPFCQLLDP